MIIKVSDIHKKIKFITLKNIFDKFGEIEGYTVQDDYFIFSYSRLYEFNVLNMDYFSLGGKRIRVSTINYTGKLDNCKTKGGLNIIFYNEVGFDIEDVKNECSMYGKIKEVYKVDEDIVVSTYSAIDSINIYLYMYGRFYDNKRIRCSIR